MHLANGVISIADGETDSSLLSAVWGSNPTKVALDNARSLTIQAPADLTGTCTIQTSQNGTDWVSPQDGGADITIGAGTSIRLPIGLNMQDLKIVSGDAEGAKRDFIVSIQEEMD